MCLMMLNVSCSLISLPEIISVDNVNMTENNDNIQFESELSVYNSSWFPIKSDSIVFKVLIDSSLVAQGNNIGDMNLPRCDTSKAKINLEVLSNQDNSFVTLSNEFDLTLLGYALLPVLNTPYYFEKIYHFEKQNLIDFVVDEFFLDNFVSIDSFQIKQVTMFNTDIQLNISIDNPADVSCTLRNFQAKIFRDNLLREEVGVVRKIEEINVNNDAVTSVVIDASLNNISMITSSLGKVKSNQFSFFLLITTDLVVGNILIPIEFEKSIELSARDIIGNKL
jgi:hypothetical protein